MSTDETKTERSIVKAGLGRNVLGWGSGPRFSTTSGQLFQRRIPKWEAVERRPIAKVRYEKKRRKPKHTDRQRTEELNDPKAEQKKKMMYNRSGLTEKGGQHNPKHNRGHNRIHHKTRQKREGACVRKSLW